MKSPEKTGCLGFKVELNVGFGVPVSSLSPEMGLITASIGAEMKKLPILFVGFLDIIIRYSTTPRPYSDDYRPLY